MKQNSLLTRMMLLVALVLMGAGTASAADKWVKTAPSALTTGDVVVIVDQTTGKAMSNNNGTSSAPSATAVTLSNDKSEITGTVDATLQWEVTVDEGSYQFGVGEDYLYCTSTNNGVRVGSNANNAFMITQGGDNNADYLVNTATNRYIGVYNSQDWRCYTSINNNIKATVTAFYKKTTTSGPVNPTVKISATTFAVGETATITGPQDLTMTFSSDDETVATVSNAGVVTGVAVGTATITASWDAVANTYNAGSATFDVAVIQATTYEQVTNANQLVAGNEYIIVAMENSMAMGAQDGSIRKNVSVTIANNKVAITDEEVAILTLGGVDGAWTFLASDNSKYLALNSASNAIHTSDDPTAEEAKWKITENFELENASISGRVLKYNSGSPRFACYASGQKMAVLFVKSGSAIDTKEDPGFSFSASTAEATLGVAFTAPTFSNPNNVAVTFASTDTDVATVEQDGTVTILAAGTTTIKATFAGNDDFKAGEASYTLTVIDPNAPGTENNPFTVAQALAANPQANVYVSGIVCEVVSTSVNSNGQIRYYISDDGTDSNSLNVYNGLGLNGAAFTSIDDIQVGDVVVVFGTLSEYSGANQLNAGNYLVSWNRPADTTPRITIDPASVNVDAVAENNALMVDGTLDITLNNITISDMSQFEVRYFTSENESTTQPAWLEVLVAEQDPAIGTGYVVSYIILDNDGEARSAYFKIYGLGDDGTTEALSNLVTVTQAKYVVDYATLPFSWDGGASADFLALNGVTASGLGSDYAASNAPYRIKFDTTGDYIQVKTDGQVYKVTVEVKMLGGGNTSMLTVQGSADGDTFTDVEELEISGAQNTVLNLETNNAFDAAYRYVRLVFTKGSNVGVGAITINLVKKSISAAGYATYCSSNALDYSAVAGLTAYKATATGSAVSFTEVNQVPANAGVLLKGAAGTYQIPVISSAAALEDNAFVGVLEETNIAAGSFVLLNGDKGVGFYKTTATFTAGAHTAYLPASVGGARSFIGFDGETTGVNAVNGEGFIVNGPVFDLQGRRVAQPQKGLYIVNGRKVVIK